MSTNETPQNPKNGAFIGLLVIGIIIILVGGFLAAYEQYKIGLILAVIGVVLIIIGFAVKPKVVVVYDANPGANTRIR